MPKGAFNYLQPKVFPYILQK
jgi:hypothetical protein